jgi:hypothetical protein
MFIHLQIGCTHRLFFYIINNKKRQKPMNHMAHTQPLPVAFAAPAQEALYRRYGDLRSAGWEARWMELWLICETFAWFPQNRIYIHKDFKAVLAPALKALEAKGLHKEVKTCDGCYSVLSVHSWGAAIDLNARENPMATAGKWSLAFIETMSSHKLYCGQSWTGRKDPMHFAMVNG